MSIERLSALEKDLREEERQQLAESRRHASEGNDETVQAFCNGKAFGLNSAAQRIANIIAELGQEVGAVADAMTLSAPPKVWLQVDTDALEDSEREPIAREHWDQLTWCAESVGGHEVVYIREDLATSPAHTSEARDAARLDWLEKHGCWQFAGPSESDIRGPAYRWFDYDTDGHDYSATLREAIDAAIAAEAK